MGFVKRGEGKIVKVIGEPKSVRICKRCHVRIHKNLILESEGEVLYCPNCSGEKDETQSR
jgi:late competence protein required for DNA uptake (superfamily II DNA/RNA helicase)